MSKRNRSYNNPIWSVERAMKQGYFLEPHRPCGSFSGERRMARPGFDCAVKTAAIYRDLHDKVKGDLGVGAGCQTQCTECAHICYMNDYIRGQAHCPPHYPVPAIRGWNECTATKDGGGVYGDWSYVSAKAAYVDWSRGTIEVY